MPTPMPPGADAEPTGSSLFLVRVWPVACGGAGPAWRGRIIHITSGQACTLHDLPALGATLVAMIAARQPPQLDTSRGAPDEAPGTPAAD
ncbi:MAG TPA: hypothetical protein VM536_14955 [Chloroflexia bacterium]|nr:hypothetical protein [Chloroflexia bacterium]